MASIILPIRGELLDLLAMSPRDAQKGSVLSSEHTAALYRLASKGMPLPTFPLRLIVGPRSNIVAKVGRSTEVDLDEAKTLDYIHGRISDFTAPKCLGAIISKDTTFVFITRAEGRPLEYVWPFLSTQVKTSVQHQLVAIFNSLRAVKQENTTNPNFGNCVSGICKEHLRSPRASSFPIQTEEDFNAFLFSHPSRALTPAMRLLRDSMPTDHELKPSHGDLHPRHIMVTSESSSEDVRITAILGWDNAGWYPEYWEFVQAVHRTESQGELRDWVEYLPTAAIGEYLTEYMKDVVRVKWIY
jgi:aminoglycoside phosphotransferase (APT) family kinase protein